ncbi:hypothetical protein M9978_02350 [Sphingomonas sp. MG17]|uniref:Uncharacterized protein n=1 Tax=Sphingomonas tagetis TaxID=2949092 RepID=A0A9X2HG59_9SPHN|nr:hypothetical protein [Sphingomonas tagetis]MCP3729257.1 hypothetical protein [Sphingomonas tagetis]
MADITITAANVIAGVGALTFHGTAGATVTAGQVGYRDRTDDRCKLADNNSGTAAVRKAKGIFLNGAASGQPVLLLTEGPITIGATLTPGTTYYLSDTPGGICPFADLASGEYATIIGIARSASVLDVKIHESGVAV